MIWFAFRLLFAVVLTGSYCILVCGRVGCVCVACVCGWVCCLC